MPRAWTRRTRAAVQHWSSEGWLRRRSGPPASRRWRPCRPLWRPWRRAAHQDDRCPSGCTAATRRPWRDHLRPGSWRALFAGLGRGWRRRPNGGARPVGPGPPGPRFGTARCRRAPEPASEPGHWSRPSMRRPRDHHPMPIGWHPIKARRRTMLRRSEHGGIGACARSLHAWDARSMATMTCPTCGYRWASNARSQKTRCGRCRSIAYVPASVRAANGTTTTRVPSRRQRPPRKAPKPSVAPAGEVELWDLPCGHRVRLRVVWPSDDDVTSWSKLGAAEITCPTCGIGTAMGEVLAHAVSVPVSRAPRPGERSPVTGAAPAPAPEPPLPGTWAVRGGLGRWRCGHEMTVPVTVDDRHPEAVPCPMCGRPGLARQRTSQGWAPIVTRAPSCPRCTTGIARCRLAGCPMS